MPEAKEHGWRWLFRHLVFPLLVALVPLVAGFWIGRLKFERTLLPIQPDPNTSAIEGVWIAEYADLDALQPAKVDPPILEAVAESLQPAFSPATIAVSVDGATFTATAMAGARVWELEGYIDGDSILYVYKDRTEPNSFGAAFLRKHAGHGDYVGVWAGRSPSFEVETGERLTNPFLVRGVVRWQRAGAD